MLGGVLGVQLKLVDRPFLDGADTRARRKVVLGGPLQVMDRRLDAPAAADMDATAVLEPLDGMVCSSSCSFCKPPPLRKRIDEQKSGIDPDHLL
jgi:hypothetical protein